MQCNRFILFWANQNCSLVPKQEGERENKYFYIEEIIKKQDSIGLEKSKTPIYLATMDVIAFSTFKIRQKSCYSK